MTLCRKWSSVWIICNQPTSYDKIWVNYVFKIIEPAAIQAPSFRMFKRSKNHYTVTFSQSKTLSCTSTRRSLPWSNQPINSIDTHIVEHRATSCIETSLCYIPTHIPTHFIILMSALQPRNRDRKCVKQNLLPKNHSLRPSDPAVHPTLLLF